MTNILKKGKKKKVREYLWDHFHLVHEHYGFENCETIDQIYKHTLEFCERKGITAKTDKINPFWRQQFRAEISQILYGLRQKYNSYRASNGETKHIKNKFYLRGFECLNKNGKGHYFYIKNKKENDLVNEQDQRRVLGKKELYQIRKLERKEYLNNQLPAHQKELLDYDGREVA